MKAQELRRKYLDYFINHNHAEIESASILPKDDGSVLFTTAGMQQFVPYLIGANHPKGRRLASVQKCIRTNDIDEVGDLTHLTFFEMLGNWSLGDYFKKESIEMSYDFLVNVLKIDKDRLAVTVFRGNKDVEQDNESVKAWKSLGIADERIGYLAEEDNWWPKFDVKGIGGPDTEIFYWNGPLPAPKVYDSEDPFWVEIWNNVFMQYFNDGNGNLEELSQKNVDTGMGLERILTMLGGHKSLFETDLFVPIITKIEEMTGKKYNHDDENSKAFRVIADHIRASVFMLGDDAGLTPGNVDHGYVIRMLIRRAIRMFKTLGVDKPDLKALAEVVIREYKTPYTELERNSEHIFAELEAEERTFSRTLNKGLKEVNKVLDELKEQKQDMMSGVIAFKLYDTYGFPLEITEELAKEQGVSVDREGFKKRELEHKEESKKGSDAKFAGGLLEDSIETRLLHTATHLLHEALNEVLGNHVEQKGSNITKERLRFDFTHPEKLTDEEKQKIEDVINEVIERDLEVTFEEIPIEEAIKIGAVALFSEKYDDIVKVYRVGDYSMEICGGPHANRSSELGHFKIIKEESAGKGIRRIRAVLTPNIK